MNTNDKKIGTTFTCGLVVRGKLRDIDSLLEYLKTTDLVLAHQRVTDRKLWFKEDSNEY
jgi:hypothetical protein